ncbi:MAG: calcium-binding protein, partial [Pseudomonadota bacterium]
MPTTQWKLPELVNDDVSSDATQPDIIQLANGNVLVAWTSSDPSAPTGSAGTDLRGQLYDPLNNEIGVEFLLNATVSTGDIELPSIVALPAGGFSVAYVASNVTPASGIPFDRDLYVDTFTDAGAFVGGGLVLNGSNGTTFPVEDLSFAAAADDRAVLQWYNPQNGDLEAQFYDPSTQSTVGSLQTTFAGPTGAGNALAGNAVTILQNGNYVLSWVEQTSAGDSVRFVIQNSTTGAFVGTPVTVQSTTTIRDPSIATLSDGRFIIAYTIDGSGGTNSGVRARIMNEDGTFSTAAFGFATTLPGNQEQTAVVGLDNGESYVFWVDEVENDVHGQRLAGDGTLIDAEFDVVNLFTSTITSLAATRLSDGRVQITYEIDASHQSVTTVIYDPRDGPNAVPVNGNQIGRLGNDVFTASNTAVSVYGHFGSDSITINSTTMGTLAVLDGGCSGGTDRLVIGAPDAGPSWDFRNVAISEIEVLEFGSQPGGALVRQVIVNADQVPGSVVFDETDAAQLESLAIFTGAQTVVDLSGIGFVGFKPATDQIFVQGDGDAETITGTVLDDTIDGMGGGDTLNGSDGNDVFRVRDTDQDERFNGDLGTDTLDFSIFSNPITLLFPNFTNNGSIEVSDTRVVYSGMENIIGSAFGDTLLGRGIVDGGGGDDTLVGRTDAEVFGGLGNDVFQLSQPGANFDGGPDIDTLEAGNLGSPRMYVVLDGGYTIGTSNPVAFDGTLTSVENYIGTTAQERIIGSSVANAILGIGGNDTIEGGAGNDTITGGGNNDLLSGGDNDDVLNGAPGNDTLNGGSGNDSLVGGSGENRLNGDAGNDTLEGGETPDVLDGGDDNDLINANGGNDTLIDGAGDDTLNGGDGFDTFVATGGGSDVFDGGDGSDGVAYEATGAAVTIDLLDQASNAGAALNDTFISIEVLRGTLSADFLGGDDGSNQLRSDAGNSTLEGRGDDDTLIGGTGDDILDGGDGVDQARYTSTTEDLVFNLAVGFFDGTAETGDDTLIGIENLSLGSGDDRVFGDAEDNTFIGGAGDNLLSGKAGNDSLVGGSDADALSGGDDNDTLRGNDGEDRLFGNNDDDSLDGGFGNDTLNGGAGNDTVRGGPGDDNAVVGGSGNDLIFGESGEDGLNGSTGNDTMDGGSNDDRVYGAVGEDNVRGGNGNDTIGGGNG